MKRWFSFLLLLVFFDAGAQTVEQVAYYYNGKKISFPVNFERIIIRVPAGETAALRRSQVAAALQLPDAAARAMADQQMLEIKLPAGFTAARVVSNIAALSKQLEVDFVHPCFKSASGKDMGYGEQLTVKLKSSVAAAAFEKLLQQMQCSIVKKYRFTDKIYVLAAGRANGFDALALANRLFETGLFEYAEPDLTLFDGLLADPNDPLYNYQWAHNNTGTGLQYNGSPGIDMKVQQAWAVSKGEGIKIAVLDEGVDLNHPDLKDNLLQGFDCTTETANPGDGKPLAPNRGHGTACTGIIAAVTNNNIGVAGLAPNSKIIPVNLAAANGDFTSYSSIAAGIDYAWQQGADIISNSWGGGTPSNTLDDAIRRALALGRGGKGTVVLFASGNNNAGLMYPSSNAGVISVGGVNMCGLRKSPGSFSCDNESWGASYGTGLDVVAPCVKIATTDISGTGGYNQAEGAAGDYYLMFNGTSAAAPNVAGVLALVLGANKNLTVGQVRTILEGSCDKLSAYNYTMVAGQPNGTWNPETGHGMVNAFAAVQRAVSGMYCTVQIKANGPTRFCPGGSTSLSVINPVAGTSYQWRRNGATVISTGSSLTVAGSGSYDLIATTANGCVATAAPISVEVTANTPALSAMAGIDTFICVGQSVKLGGNPVAAGGAPWLAEKRAYGMDWLTNNFIKFSLSNPLQFDTISNQVVTDAEYTSGQFFTGGDFTPYGYYAITQKTNKLVKIDTATGAQQLIGIAAAPAGNYYQWAGLAWDPSGKILYALASGLDSSSLCIVDPFTAQVTQVAVIPVRLTYWLAVNNNGDMYTVSFTDNHIYRINKFTGAATALPNNIGAQLVGQAEPSVFSGRQDADFDPVTNQLYITSVVNYQNMVSDLRTVDINTGSSSVVGALGGLSSIDATAIAGPGYRYHWAPAEGLNNTSVSVPVARPLLTTTYTLQVTDMCGNTASSQLTVHVNTTKPVVAIKAATDSICIGETVRLSATKGNGYSYQWYRNGRTLAQATDSFYVATAGGKYTVKVQSGSCDSLSLPFTVKTCEIRMNSNEPAQVCNYYFFDSGGELGNYADNESFTRTITAAVPGCVPQITLDSFNTQVNDLLYVYDGPTTASALLSLYSGPIKGPLTVRASTNTLTLRFVSNGSVNMAGWSGTISCYQPKVYRSRQTGNYTDVNTWEQKSGNEFIVADHIPLADEDSIIIQPGDTVTISSALTLDQVWVKAGAVLILSGDGNLALKDGPGDDLLVDGTLEMTGGTYLSGLGKLRLNGSLNASTTNGQSVYSAIEVGGSSPQTINTASSLSSLYISNPAVTINIQGYVSIDTLLVNNSAGVVNINGGAFLNIRNQLNLQSGRVKMGKGTVLNIPQISSIAGGNAGSFVEGLLRRNNTASGTLGFFYPVGNGVYRPVTLVTNSPANYNSSYQVEVANTPTLSRMLPTGINAISDKRHITVSNEGSSQGPYGATIHLSYGQDDGVTDAASLRIVKDDGAGGWTDLGGTGASNGKGSIASTINFTSFGDFLLANAVGGNNVLPVKWLNVNAQQAGKQVHITWTVSDEINVKHYTVQGSADGLSFRDLALVTATASSAVEKQYGVYDASPLKGPNYYRIKQTDSEGRNSLSKTVMLTVNNAGGIVLLPNPATETITIQNSQLIQQLLCYNSNGQLIYEAKPVATRHTIAVQQWAAGVYHVKIICGGAVVAGRFVKK